MKKIKAYTLMEVTIAMLLSAICFSVCYTAYGLIGNYYNAFREKNETADAALALRHVLDKDFLNSRYVLKTDSGIELQKAAERVLYTFHEESVWRELKGLHTDTFKLRCQDMHLYFEGQEVLVPDTIDRLEVNVLLDKETKLQFRTDKRYSAENLFQ